MTSQMQYRSGLLLVALVLGTVASADPPASDAQFSAAELRTHAAFGPDGQARFELWSGPGFRVQYNQRNGPGEVEVHTRISDVFVIEEGQASMNLGGQVDGGHEIAPNELRGGRIVGGHTRKLVPGDVVWVPAGEPHQIIPTPGRIFRYEVVKVEARASASDGQPDAKPRPKP